MNKKAFYFTMDALFSSFLLIGGLLLISQYLVKEPTTESIDFAATDVLSVLSELKMSEVNSINSTFVSTYLNSSNTDLNISVLEQIGSYWAANNTNNLTMARNLTEFVLKGYLPSNTGMSLVIEDDVIYNKSIGKDHSNALVGERMITGIEEGAPLTGSTSSAYLKKIQDKTTASFAYFGGFVGQGIITVRLDNLPLDINISGNVQEMFLEGEYDSDFQLKINNVYCREISVANSQVQRFNVTNCSAFLKPGNNTVTLNFTEGITNASVSGGLLGVKYVTSYMGTTEETGSKRTYLPDIDGVINLYDGFMVPGNLQEMEVYLHYWVNESVTLPIFLDIGNETVYDSNSTGHIATGYVSISIPDGLLKIPAGKLDYTNMSSTTVPLRLGFFSGTNTITTGNISDIFLLTSLTGTMNISDITVTSAPNRTRIQEARIVDNLFVDIVVNASGNRVGLVGYGNNGNSPPDLLQLTTNATKLHNRINSSEYDEASSVDAQRNLCEAMRLAKTQLNITSNSGRKRAIVLMTDGDLKKPSGNTKSCQFGSDVQISDRAQIWRDAVNEACNFTDNSTDGNQYNITFYTIAFGMNATNDQAIIDNLTRMATCTGGNFSQSNNASGLEEIYRNFATQLAASSVVYTFQRATSVTDVASRLYNDSYIEITYEPPIPAAQQSQIPITFQTPPFGNCSPTITIPDGVIIVDARVVSYSGDLWTKTLIVSNNVVYNLSRYGNLSVNRNFTDLGDPYQLFVPPDLLTPGDHVFNIALGTNSSNESSSCANDSLIYTGLIVAATNRTIVLPSADGCNWTVESEDFEFQSLKVPAGYTGANLCYYTNSTGAVYDHEDAYDVGVFNLLRQLDPDDDKRVSINFAEEDLEITITLVTDVPYLWGPTLVKASVWQ